MTSDHPELYIESCNGDYKACNRDNCDGSKLLDKCCICYESGYCSNCASYLMAKYEALHDIHEMFERNATFLDVGDQILMYFELSAHVVANADREDINRITKDVMRQCDVYAMRIAEHTDKPVQWFFFVEGTLKIHTVGVKRE